MNLEVGMGRTCFEMIEVIQAEGGVDWPVVMVWDVEKNGEIRNVF